MPTHARTRSEPPTLVVSSTRGAPFIPPDEDVPSEEVQGNAGVAGMLAAEETSDSAVVQPRRNAIHARRFSAPPSLGAAVADEPTPTGAAAEPPVSPAAAATKSVFATLFRRRPSIDSVKNAAPPSAKGLEFPSFMAEEDCEAESPERPRPLGMAPLPRHARPLA